MKRITIETRVRQNKDILASNIDEEKVMMSIEKGLYYGLNSVGSHIYDLIGKTIQVSSLIDAVRTKYDVERGDCERDVLDFLEDLYKKGLLLIEE